MVSGLIESERWLCKPELTGNSCIVVMLLGFSRCNTCSLGLMCYAYTRPHLAAHYNFNRWTGHCVSAHNTHNYDAAIPLIVCSKFKPLQTSLSKQTACKTLGEAYSRRSPEVIAVAYFVTVLFQLFILRPLFTPFSISSLSPKGWDLY